MDSRKYFSGYNDKTCEGNFPEKLIYRDDEPVDLRDKLNKRRENAKTETTAKLTRTEARLQNRQVFSNAIKSALGLQPRPRRIVKVKDEISSESEVETQSKAPIEVQIEKGKNVEAKEFHPRRVEIAIVDTSPALYIHPIYYELPVPVEAAPPVPVSKLQSRLTRIRTETQPINEAQLEQIDVKNAPQVVQLKIEAKETSQELQPHDELISTLPHEQQSQLHRITNLPRKYFQEAFDYFLSYYEDSQCVPLNHEAINSFLTAKGISTHESDPTHMSYDRRQFPDLQTFTD